MGFQVTILGSSSAMPHKGRHQSAQLLKINNRFYLIDCGEGTQKRLIEQGVSLLKINEVFISHLHGDHIFGLVPLLTSMYMNGRKSELRVYSPKGLAGLVAAHFEITQTDPGFTITYIDTDTEHSNIIFENEGLTVSTIPLKHRLPCAGFLFREQNKKPRIDKNHLEKWIGPREIHKLLKGEDIEFEGVVYPNSRFANPPRKPKSYAYCSDTSFQTNIIPFVQGIDFLYHESTFLEKEADRAERTMHSTAKQAASIAKEAGVKQLLMGHFSTRYPDLSYFEKEAREIFTNASLAVEGKIYTIDDEDED